jgi:hypothetical protein
LAPPRTVDFQIDGAEFNLYREVTRFAKRKSARAAARDKDPRARAIGFIVERIAANRASNSPRISGCVKT